MTKNELKQEMKDVIATTRKEREFLISKDHDVSVTELNTVKTIVSANKNIVSAALVIKALLDE